MDATRSVLDIEQLLGHHAYVVVYEDHDVDECVLCVPGMRPGSLTFAQGEVPSHVQL